MRTTQNGAVLIVSLLLLLVMTIIGVAGMSSTVMEEKMANNNRQKQLASQSASGALREAELWLSTNITTAAEFEAQFSGTPDELYWSRRPTPAQNLKVPALVELNSADWAVANSETTPSTLTLGTESAPRYFIEYVGRVGEVPLDATNPDSREYAFRISAIGWGMDDVTSYVVKSSFRMQLL